MWITENKLKDITWRMIDEAEQLIELTLQIKDGPESRTISMKAHPAKLQTLLYGQWNFLVFLQIIPTTYSLFYNFKTDMEKVRNLIDKQGLDGGKISDNNV